MSGSRKKKKSRQILAGVIAAILILAMVLSLVLSAAAAESSASAEKTIADGITLNGTDLSGMTESEARTLAQSMVEQRKNAVITMTGQEEGQSVSVSAGNLGLSWANSDIISTIAAYGHGCNPVARYKEEKDLEQNGGRFSLEFEFNKDTISNFITNNCTVWDVAADSGTVTKADGVISLSGGTAGSRINIETSTDKIYNYLKNEWTGEDAVIALDVEETGPSETGEEVTELTDVLGTFTTYYTNSGAARCTNIANGCALINGTTVYPGQEFSVLQTITPFTEENGYQLAGSYLNNEVVESLGGGICQVSTTLYNAAIRAELQITARSNHSLVVSYVQLSEDAAIAESANMDMRFINTTDYPIYIEGITYNKSITFNIYGVETRDPGRSVSFESEMLEEIPSEGTTVKTDATQPIGYVETSAGHTGYRAQLWKIVTQDGVQQSREVFNKSTYAMTPMTITVGTAGTMTEELQAAIDSGELDTIKAAAEDAANGIDNGSGDGQTTEELTAAAQQAAQEAYAQALADGSDTNAAMEAAQNAANAVVQQAAEAGTVSTEESASASESAAAGESASAPAPTPQTAEEAAADAAAEEEQAAIDAELSAAESQ